MSKKSSIAAAASLLVLSLCSWTLPILSLKILLDSMGLSTHLGDLAQVFGVSCILGNMTGIPAGIGVGSSILIMGLENLGIASSTSVMSIMIFRLSTVWLMVCIGILSTIIFRRSVISSQTGQMHFDRLAPDYDNDLPGHVREKLLDRKMDITRQHIMSHCRNKIPSGCDIGCGQGHHLITFAKNDGFAMTGVDSSTGQIQCARENLSKAGVTAELITADVCNLPIADNRFDFVYAINFLHHIVDPVKQQRALGEIARILVPGGIFILHEINVKNPLFYLYMRIIFPLFRMIDDGTELWIRSSSLPEISHCTWSSDIRYFTFLPDFFPAFLTQKFAGIERLLEKTFLKRWSAHYTAFLVKESNTLEKEVV
ncbi:MAG: methyltransferase domain-containing protein [Oligoflexales bacterium]|nr:methyltransferase domain-containing protein [Oligoflexales bacterium]